MADNTRELDQIQTELDRLHERSQTNKATISAHEAVCEERYAQIISTLTALSDEMKTKQESKWKQGAAGEVSCNHKNYAVWFRLTCDIFQVRITLPYLIFTFETANSLVSTTLCSL